MSSAEAPALALSGVGKRFGATQALTEARLALWPGEIHALMGENGAGKSTLIKLLAGVERADALTAEAEGKPVRLQGPEDAARLGIRVVHQELAVAPALTVAETIHLGRPLPRRMGLVRWGRLNAQAADALARLGAGGIDPRARMGRLGTGERLLVVLAGLLVSSTPPPRIFVLDEPTAALTHREADRLFDVLEDLREQGAAMLYVSHRIDEVMELADRVTVLRDGRVALSSPMDGLERGALIRAMTGREMREAPAPARTARRGLVVCAAEGLSVGRARKVGFELREGEVLGLAGLDGAGQSEILRAVLGAGRAEAGRVRVDGRAGPRRPSAGWRTGIAYVPRERRREALMPRRSITANAVLPHLGGLSVAGLAMIPGAERQMAATLAERVRLRFQRLGQPVRTLSGGNQQKVVFARALAGAPRLLLLDEPSRGVDIGARAELHALVRAFTATGGAVLLASSDLPELLALSDRLLVLREGGGALTVPAQGLTAEALLGMIYGAPRRLA